MENTFNINEAIKYMKDNAIITSNGNDSFSMIDDFICYRFNGSSISLSVDDFIKLFKDTTFSLIENDSFTVDELKDKEYYEKYRK